MSELPYSYNKHGNSKYYGKALLTVAKCSGDHQFKVSESFIAIDTDGIVGSIGDGPKWFLNYVTQSGACCFNPIDVEDLLWSPYHNAYIYEYDKEHFLFPVRIGGFYELKDGVKTLGMFNNEPIHKLPKNQFTKMSEYF